MALQKEKTKMMEMLKLIVGGFSMLACLVLIGLMVFLEFNFKDLTFATIFGIFSVIGAITYFVLTRNDDNEETNPGKEKVKR